MGRALAIAKAVAMARVASIAVVLALGPARAIARVIAAKRVRAVVTKSIVAGLAPGSVKERAKTVAVLAKEPVEQRAKSLAVIPAVMIVRAVALGRAKKTIPALAA